MEYGDIRKLFTQRKEAYDRHCYERDCKAKAEFFKDMAEKYGFEVSKIEVEGDYIGFSVKIDGKDVNNCVINLDYVSRKGDIAAYEDFIRRNLEFIQSEKRRKKESMDEIRFSLWTAVQELSDAHSELIQFIWNVYGDVRARIPDDDKKLLNKTRENLEKGLDKVLTYLDKTIEK